MVLLDAAVGPMIFIAFSFFLLFFAGIVFVETFVLVGFKYDTFKKSLKDAFLVNLASAVVGIVMQMTMRSSFLSGVPGYTFTHQNYMNRLLLYLLLFFLVTLAVETFLLRRLNKSIPTQRLIVISLCMNLLTYILIFFVWPF